MVRKSNIHLLYHMFFKNTVGLSSKPRNCFRLLHLCTRHVISNKWCLSMRLMAMDPAVPIVFHLPLTFCFQHMK